MVSPTTSFDSVFTLLSICSHSSPSPSALTFLILSKLNVLTRQSTNYAFTFLLLYFFRIGLLRLQAIYQGLRPGNETFQVETVKRITNATNAIEFLKTLEDLNRWSKKYIVLDCATDMAKDIVVYHVRDLSLGRRTYHYLLSGLVSLNKWPKYFSLFSFPSFSLESFRSLLLRCVWEMFSLQMALTTKRLNEQCSYRSHKSFVVVFRLNFHIYRYHHHIQFIFDRLK